MNQRRPTTAEALSLAAGHLDPDAFTLDPCCDSCGQRLPDLDSTLGATN